MRYYDLKPSLLTLMANSLLIDLWRAREVIGDTIFWAMLREEVEACGLKYSEASYRLITPQHYNHRVWVTSNLEDLNAKLTYQFVVNIDGAKLVFDGADKYFFAQTIKDKTSDCLVLISMGEVYIFDLSNAVLDTTLDVMPHQDLTEQPRLMS